MTVISSSGYEPVDIIFIEWHNVHFICKNPSRPWDGATDASFCIILSKCGGFLIALITCDDCSYTDYSITVSHSCLKTLFCILESSGHVPLVTGYQVYNNYFYRLIYLILSFGTDLILRNYY